MRVQTGASMSAKESRAFQTSIRRGLRATAEKKYRDKLAAIDAEIGTQRTTCAANVRALVDAHDAAVSRERVALAKARADKKEAEAARKAAAERLAAERAKEKGAKEAKKLECKIEADGLKAKKTAEKAYHDELRTIERSTEQRKRPLSTAAERREEERESVEHDIPDEYRPLWRRVRRTFRVPARGEGWMSLREAFIRYAEEDPEAVAAAQEADADAYLQSLQRQHGNGSNGGKRRRKSPAAESRAELPPAPF